MNPRVPFSELTMCRLFMLNGNDYVKQSTRTARMLSNGKSFYIGKNELVHKFAR